MPWVSKSGQESEGKLKEWTGGWVWGGQVSGVDMKKGGELLKWTRKLGRLLPSGTIC